MGNYQEYLKKLHSESPPLRQLENTPTRVHMFGNPFKVNKVRDFSKHLTKWYLSNVCDILVANLLYSDQYMPSYNIMIDPQEHVF